MKKYTILFSLLMVTIVVSITSCNSGHNNTKPIIATSILPIKYFAESIAGDKWDVVSIIPPSANHTNYEPTPNDLKKVADATLYLETGNIGFEEAWSLRFKEIAKSCTFIDISDNIEKIGGHYHDGEYHGADPHYWLSPKEALIISKNIMDALIAQDPDNQELYHNNLAKLSDIINKTDKTIEDLLYPISGQSFLIYHPALTYFASYYGLNQVAIEDHGKEPSASTLADIIDFAKDNNIKIILYQSQYTGNSVQSIAKEIKVETICFDPMAYNWPENMLTIAHYLIDNSNNYSCKY